MKKNDEITVSEEVILTKIVFVRGVKVMIDSDLAELYGVTTKRLNEQVKLNLHRFPGDFMFRLTAEEKEEVVAKCDHLYFNRPFMTNNPLITAPFPRDLSRG